MKAARPILIALAAGLLLSGPGAAQETPETAAEPELPDLASLGQNWWDYFKGSREELEPRVGRFLEQVNARIADLGQLADDLSSICARFRQRLRNYCPHFMIIAHWQVWSTGGGRPILDSMVKRFAKRV